MLPGRLSAEIHTRVRAATTEESPSSSLWSAPYWRVRVATVSSVIREAHVTIAARRERDRLSMPVTTEWVAEHFPELRIEFLEEDAG